MSAKANEKITEVRGFRWNVGAAKEIRMGLSEEVITG